MNLAEQYINHLRYVKHRSENTLTSYSYSLREFEKCCEGNPLENAKKIHLRTFLYNLTDKKVSPKTINQNLRVIRSFFKYCKRFHGIENNSMIERPKLRESKRIPLFIEENIMMEILDEMNPGLNRKKQRDQLIFELLYATGCRKAELLSIKRKDVNVNKKEIRIIGKGNKERVLILTDRVSGLIQNFMAVWPYKTEYLIETNSRKPLNSMFLLRKMHEYFPQSRTGISPHPHIFRHSFATHLLNRGAPLGAIKDLLGHSSLVSTQIYASVYLSRMKDLHNKAHPKALSEDWHVQNNQSYLLNGSEAMLTA